MNRHELQALYEDLKFTIIVIIYFTLLVLGIVLTNGCATVDYTDTGVGCIDDCLEPAQVQMDNISREVVAP